tara:strand:- start:393 stop:596 length:204 start_codon:yes stop_codon:yes gene_type:complete
MIGGDVHILEKQLITANKRVASLSAVVKKLDNDLRKIEYELSGIAIYLHDVKELFDYERRKQLEKEL